MHKAPNAVKPCSMCGERGKKIENLLQQEGPYYYYTTEHYSNSAPYYNQILHCAEHMSRAQQPIFEHRDNILLVLISYSRDTLY